MNETNCWQQYIAPVKNINIFDQIGVYFGVFLYFSVCSSALCILTTTRLIRGVPQPQRAHNDKRYCTKPFMFKGKRSSFAFTGIQAESFSASSFCAKRSASSTQLVEVQVPSHAILCTHASSGRRLKGEKCYYHLPVKKVTSFSIWRKLTFNDTLISKLL